MPEQLDGSPLDNKTFQWIAGITLTILLAVAGLIHNNLDVRLNHVENQGAPIVREKIARLESQSDTFRRDIEEIKRSQKEIIDLLRLVLEKGH